MSRPFHDRKWKKNEIQEKKILEVDLRAHDKTINAKLSPSLPPTLCPRAFVPLKYIGYSLLVVLMMVRILHWTLPTRAHTLRRNKNSMCNYQIDNLQKLWNMRLFLSLSLSSKGKSIRKHPNVFYGHTGIQWRTHGNAKYILSFLVQTNSVDGSY